VCFQGILIRLVTGASWVDVEAILEHQVSDTTLRRRATSESTLESLRRSKLRRWQRSTRIGWAIDGANRNDVAMLVPTLEAIDTAGLLRDVGMVHLDRSYDSPAVRERLVSLGITEFEIQRRGTRVAGVKKQPLRLGLHWIVEATNTWWSNYGQLRRNTDRRARHRHAALCLATVILIVGKLITWRNRWSPT